MADHPRFPSDPRPLQAGPLARRALRALALAAVALILAACASTEKNDPTSKWDADRLYREAHDEFLASNWGKSRELFEKLESRFPFGRYAQQAQLEIAYTYYKEGDVPQTLSAVERFLKENPNHPNADYAHYLRGLANFNESPLLVGKWFGYRVAERDPKAQRESFEAFKELATRYPDSRYTPDAIERMHWLVNQLAQHEVAVARFYFERSAYLAVIERAQGVVRDYPAAPSVEEALTLMAASYGRLGMKELQDDTLRVLARSFPDRHAAHSTAAPAAQATAAAAP